MKYRKHTQKDLEQALVHLGSAKKKEFTIIGEEFLDPRKLIEDLGVSSPYKQKEPLEFLENEENYSWKELMVATVPPVVVINGLLADGFHRCRVCAVLGLKVKAIIYERKQ